MTQKDRKLIVAEILNRCWDDETFKAQFVENPAKVLADAGIPVDAEKTYRVVENTESAQYVVLPEKDAAAVLEQLKNAAAQKENFIPAGKEIRFVQNSDAVKYIILPKKPADQLTGEQLEQIAGGDYAQVYTDVQTVVHLEMGVEAVTTAVVAWVVFLI